MVKHTQNDLDPVFSSLADSTRRTLLYMLTQGETTVSQLAEPFDMSLAAISKHLKVLEKAGLLNRRIEGRVHHLSLAAAGLREASEWLLFYQEFWQDSLDALALIITEDEDSTD